MNCTHDCNQGRSCTCRPPSEDRQAAGWAMAARVSIAICLIASIASVAALLAQIGARGA